MVSLFFFSQAQANLLRSFSFGFCGEAGSAAKYSVLTRDVAELPAATADQSLFLPVLF